MLVCLPCPKRRLLYSDPPPPHTFFPIQRSLTITWLWITCLFKKNENWASFTLNSKAYFLAYSNRIVVITVSSEVQGMSNWTEAGQEGNCVRSIAGRSSSSIELVDRAVGCKRCGVWKLGHLSHPTEFAQLTPTVWGRCWMPGADRYLLGAGTGLSEEKRMIAKGSSTSMSGAERSVLVVGADLS
jgi:hypothetical protein